MYSSENRKKMCLMILAKTILTLITNIDQGGFFFNRFDAGLQVKLRKRFEEKLNQFCIACSV